MFIVKDFVSACALRNKYLARDLPPELVSALTDRAKYREIANREYEKRGEKLNLSNEERNALRQRALIEITDSEISDRLRAERESAFFLRLMLGPLFVMNDDESAMPVHLTILYPRFSPMGSGGRAASEPLYFINKMSLSVSVGPLIDAIQGAKKVLAFNEGSPLSKLTISYLHRLVDLEANAKVLLPHEGKLLAVARETAFDVDLLWKSFMFEGVPGKEGAVDLAADSPKLGRPRKVDDAALVYAERFPSGHAGYTYKEVCKILKVEHGVDVSVDTLKNAIKLLRETEKGTEE